MIGKKTRNISIGKQTIRIIIVKNLTEITKKGLNIMIFLLTLLPIANISNASFVSVQDRIYEKQFIPVTRY